MRIALATIVLLALGCSSGDKKQPDKQPAATDDKPTETPPATDEPKPKPDKPAVKRDPVAYKQALAEGRKLGSSEPDKAIAAFERALKAMPEDAVALSELSWLYVKTNRYDDAIKAGKRSVKAGSNPKVKAMSLYNLGRAYEGQDKRKQAIKAYRQSNQLRPHTVVRGRLARLTGTTAKQLLDIWQLEGPYKSFKELCVESFDSYSYGPGDDKEEWAERLSACDNWEHSDAEAAPPFLTAGLFEVCSEPYTKGRQCSILVVVQVKKGWFVGGAGCTYYGTRETCDGDLSMVDGEKLLVATIDHSNTETWYEGDDNEIDMSSSQTLEMFCGVGASGTPGCVSYETAYSGRDEHLKELEYRIESSLEDRRKLVLAAATSKKKLPTNIRALLGKHKLVFP